MKKTAKKTPNITNVDTAGSTFVTNTIPQSQVEGLVEHVEDNTKDFRYFYEYISSIQTNISKTINDLEKKTTDTNKLHKELVSDCDYLFGSILKLLEKDKNFIKNLYDRHFKTVYFLIYSTAINICFLAGIIIYLAVKH